MANNIQVAGTCGRDAELKFFANGDAVASFSVADNQFGKGKDGNPKPPIWWNCSIFGQRAEKLSQYILKGSHITVFGNVTQRDWTDDQGVLHKAMEIRVSEVTLQGGKKESTGDDW